MSIKKVVLENFQSHKDTTLELSDGMNVIWGPSDNGKSSIMRGIRWVALNRPQGDDFRRHNTNQTNVTLSTENFDIKRKKSNSKNEYEIGETVFKALRSTIPEDVQTSLNLTEANIQQQHEVYFLVDKSPGQRSKILNEVAGLQLMDKFLKKTNSDIKVINSNINDLNSDIEDTDANIKQLDWLNKADIFLKKLEKYKNQLEENEDRYEFISEIIEEIEELENEKSKFMSDQCINDLDELIKLKKKIFEAQNGYDHIMAKLNKIDVIINKLDSMKVIDLSELEKLQHKIVFLEEKYKCVQYIIEEIEDNELDILHYSLAINGTEKKIKAELKKLGKCPTCGAVT